MKEIDLVTLRQLLRIAYRSEEDRKCAKLILGPPGIGKSRLVRELAKELAEESNKELAEYSDDIADELLSNPDKYFVLVDLRLTEIEPADLIGIPREENGCVIYKPLKWGRVLQRCSGILFLDEITNVQRFDVQAAMFKLLLDRKVGFIPLNSGVMVIAAGNRPEDSSIAVNLPAPAVNRLDVYYLKAPSIDEWKQWMDDKYGSWDRRVYSFLKKNPQFFIERPESAETLEQFATPRRWTSLAVSTVGAVGINDEIFEHMVRAKVGLRAAVHFIAFTKAPTVEPEEILKNPEIWLELQEESKYMSMVQLVAVLERDLLDGNMDKFKGFIRLLYEKDREFLSVMISMMSRDAAIRFVLVATKNSDFEYLIEYIKKLRKRILGGGK